MGAAKQLGDHDLRHGIAGEDPAEDHLLDRLDGVEIEPIPDRSEHNPPSV
jgi:hypothetical protein